MKFIIAIFVLIFPLATFAYEPTQTHAGFTEQVVEFYNVQLDRKITDAQKNFIITGAVAEDNPSLRALNHFYDPIRNIGIEGGRTAKDWALVDTAANEYSWDDVLKYYAEGNEEQAFIGLGHILHLIEDMGVPDHTRNDQHVPFLSESVGGHSPYEDWAKENKNRHTMKGLSQSFLIEGFSAKSFSLLGDYFDFIANYSNKNFFSRDTIGQQDIYAKPQVIAYEQDYGYWVDEISNKKEPIIKRKVLENKDVFFVLRDKDDTSVLSSYFDRLALQIIPSGAGVIELFFREGEKARLIYEAELQKKQQAEAQANANLARSLSQKGFLGLVWSGAVFLVQDNIFSPLGNYVFKPIGSTVSFSARFVFEEAPVAGNMAKFATVATARVVKDTAVAGGNFVAEKATQGLTIIQQTVTSALNTPVDPRSQLVGPIFAVDQNATDSFVNAGPVIPIVVTLSPQGGTPSTTIAPPKLVFVGSFSGFGGGSPNSAAQAVQQVLGVQDSASSADETSTTNETIGGVPAGAALAAPALSTPQCLQTLATDGCLLATTTVRFEWPAVSGAVYYLLNKNGTNATTTNTTLDVEIKDFSDYTLEINSVGANGEVSATSTQVVSVATIPLAINEIAWMGTKASYTDEWFEIKNNTAHTIDLSQWELNAKDNTPHVKLKGAIAPHAYLIFERTDDTAVKDIQAHATTTGSLNDKGDQLSLFYTSTSTNLTTIFDQTPDGAWVAGATSTKQTMERYSSRESGTDPSNWGTNLGYIKNGTDAKGNDIEGTPGAQNSVSTLINKGEDIMSDLTLTADEERYVVPNQVWVGASSTLTIEPGVTISFLRGGFVINGAVAAHGTAEKPIIFNSFSGNHAGDFWIDNATGTSTFEYARFENMNNVFSVDGGVLEVSNSEFLNTDGAVNTNGTNSVSFVENTHFASSTDSTIGVYSGGTVHIASSTIDDQLDGDAINAFASHDGTPSVLNIASTTIDGVHDGNGIAAYDSFVSIASSTVRNTEGDAIWLSNSTSTIANVVVESGPLDDEASGIAISGGTAQIIDPTVSGFADGSGISVSDPSEPVSISGGEISGNAVGVSYSAGDVVLLDGISVHDNGVNVMVGTELP